MTTVVVVDDSEIELNVFTTMLTEAGYECVGIQDPEKALDVIKVKQPDFILLDYSMPHKDGLSLCKDIKLNPLTRDIPVMFLSSHANSDDIIATMHLGCVDYIRKPVHAKTLVETLVRHEIADKFKNIWSPAKLELERVIKKYRRDDEQNNS